MSYRGVVFFDYDGTIADEKSNIFAPTARTCETLSALSENGYLTVLATGRAMCYVPHMPNAHFDGYVTTNGAYAQIHGETIYESALNKEHLQALIKAMDAQGMYYSLENQDRCFAKDRDHPAFRQMLENFKIPFDIFYPLSELGDADTSKLLVAYEDEEKFSQFEEEFRDRFGIYKHRLNKSADINAIGINKAVGAEAIIRHFGIPIENTYALGDGSNDYELLRLVGHGIAMETHADVLDEVAEYVTDSVVNEGIFTAMKAFGLI